MRALMHVRARTSKASVFSLKRIKSVYRQLSDSSCIYIYTTYNMHTYIHTYIHIKEQETLSFRVGSAGRYACRYYIEGGYLVPGRCIECLHVDVVSPVRAFEVRECMCVSLYIYIYIYIYINACVWVCVCVCVRIWSEYVDTCMHG